MLCLHAVTDEDGHPKESEDESGIILCAFWSKVFEARAEGERHHRHETILGYVQKAPDDIQLEIDRHEFDETMASKKESPPGPDGIPHSIYRCARGLGHILVSLTPGFFDVLEKADLCCREGCPACGFLFAMAFDPIFRWLQDTIIPNNPAAPDLLQPSPCAYADDFAVAASSS